MSTARALTSATLATLGALVLGCGADDRGNAAFVGSNGEPQAAETRLFLAAVCEQPGPEGRVLAALNPARADGRQRVCVDMKNTISLSEDVFRTHVLAEDEIYVELRCGGSQDVKNAVQELPDQGSIAIVLSDKVVATLHYLDKRELIPGCGIIPMSEFNFAMDMCESIASGLGREAEACSMVCDQKVAQELKQVCIAVNGKRPYP